MSVLQYTPLFVHIYIRIYCTTSRLRTVIMYFQYLFNRTASSFLRIHAVGVKLVEMWIMSLVDVQQSFYRLCLSPSFTHTLLILTLICIGVCMTVN